MDCGYRRGHDYDKGGGLSNLFSKLKEAISYHCLPDQEAYLNQAAEALRKDWSYLEPCSVPFEKVKVRSEVFIRKITDSGRSVDAYVKIYAYRKHPFQRYLRKGRAITEARNLLFFDSIDIQAPRVLAWGERRNRIGRIIQEFIITEAVPGAVQLIPFVKEHCPEPGRPVRRKIAEQLGRWTRVMHDHGFVHEDLKWRNVLVRAKKDEPELFWIDCPIGGFLKPGLKLERKKLKDCATLDKLARIECSKEEREAFVKAYLGTDAAGDSIRHLCRRIEKYRSARFDAKDDRQRADAEKEKRSGKRAGRKSLWPQ